MRCSRKTIGMFCGITVVAGVPFFKRWTLELTMASSASWNILQKHAIVWHHFLCRYPPICWALPQEILQSRDRRLSRYKFGALFSPTSRCVPPKSNLSEDQIVNSLINNIYHLRDFNHVIQLETPLIWRMLQSWRESRAVLLFEPQLKSIFF